MTQRPARSLAALTFGLALLFAPACDKGGEKKADDKKAEDAKKADDKKEAAADTKKGEHEGMHAGHGEGGEAKADRPKTADAEAGGRVDIEVDAGGYHPAEISAPAKAKVTLAFKRTTDQGCGQELVIEAMELKKDLPLNETVEIEVEVPESGELKFACGMDMYRGKVVPKA